MKEKHTAIVLAAGSGKRHVLISTCGFYSAEGNYDSVLRMFDHFLGKGLVQQPIEFSDGSAIRLTIARYYT